MDESIWTLRRLFAAHEDAIIDAGPAWVRETAAGDLGGRLRGLVADDVRAPAALLPGHPRPRDPFIEHVTPVRKGRRSCVSARLRGCSALHRALEPLLARHRFPADALA